MTDHCNHDFTDNSALMISSLRGVVTRDQWMPLTDYGSGGATLYGELGPVSQPMATVAGAEHAQSLIFFLPNTIWKGGPLG